MKRLMSVALLLAPAVLFSPGATARAQEPVAAEADGAVVIRDASLTVDSEWMATRDRSRANAIQKLEREVSDRIAAAGVPRSWKVPDRLVRSLIRSKSVTEIDKGYGPLYRTHLDVAFAGPNWERLRNAYDDEIAGRRLVGLGVVLSFLLFCLAAVAGYIRADEATRGYYTNSLRIAAASGVSAAAFCLYRYMA